MAAAQVLEMTAIVQVRDDGQQYAAVIPEERLQAIFAGEGLAQITEKVCELAKAEALAGDTSLLLQTSKGRQSIKSLAFKVTRTKTALDDLGKSLVAELKELPRRIDSNRKTMREVLDALAEEIRKPVTEWEQATKILSDRLNWIDGLPASLANATSEQVSEAYSKTVVYEPIDAQVWGSFFDEAKAIIPRVNRALLELVKTRKKAEDDAAELQRLRCEAEERDRKDAEERRIREATARATREAEERADRERQAALGREAEAKRQAELSEQRRIEAEQRAKEAERLAAERADQAQKAAVEAEQRRQAEEEARKLAEEERRKADQENFRRVNREAADDIMAIVAEVAAISDPATRYINTARAVVKGIINGQVRNVSIKY